MAKSVIAYDKQLQKLRHALARVPDHDERDGSTNDPTP